MGSELLNLITDPNVPTRLPRELVTTMPPPPRLAMYIVPGFSERPPTEVAPRTRMYGSTGCRSTRTGRLGAVESLVPL